MWTGARRRGFTIEASANVSIEGFDFVGFSAQFNDGTSGLPIQTIGNTVSDGIYITRNSFGPLALRNGQGAINLIRAGAVTVFDNEFKDIIFGSGIRVGGSPGPVMIACNSFARLGRTAVALINVYSAAVQRNTMDDISAIHGNGISSYLDNRVIDISDNVVSNTLRPVTLQGFGVSPYWKNLGVPDPVTAVNRNVVSSLNYHLYGTISWGNRLANASVDSQITVGSGHDYRFQVGDTNVSFTNGTQTLDERAFDTKRAENARACAVPGAYPFPVPVGATVANPSGAGTALAALLGGQPSGASGGLDATAAITATFDAAMQATALSATAQPAGPAQGDGIDDDDDDPAISGDDS